MEKTKVKKPNTPVRKNTWQNNESHQQQRQTKNKQYKITKPKDQRPNPNYVRYSQDAGHCNIQSRPRARKDKTKHEGLIILTLVKLKNRIRARYTKMYQ
jgi:hypothetical protein